MDCKDKDGSGSLEQCPKKRKTGPTEEITSFLDPRFQWLNNPTSWKVTDEKGEQEGSCGGFSVTGPTMTLRAPAKKDFWRRTYYAPTLLKDDGPALLLAIGPEQECTVCVDFELTPKAQFDQAGLLVYLDPTHWLKCGIEFCDGVPRLSCVVTNVFSDWSTQPWKSTGARLRLHKVLQGESVVIEAAELGCDKFEFSRIAHLSTKMSSGCIEGDPESNADASWRVGPFACCPIKQSGCEVQFSNFRLGPRIASVHSDDASH